MWQDIEIPIVKNVFIAAIQEWNVDFQENCWYAYLINATNEKLEMAIIVSKAYGVINGEDRKTGMMRHVFNELAPQTAVKIELLENNVLQLNNEFSVSYFQNNKMFDKKFIFKTNSINTNAQRDLPAIKQRGVLAI